MTACKANDLFDSIDADRNGLVSFKEFHQHLPKFLGIKDEERKRKPKGASPKEAALDEATLTRICDHLGTKAQQKHKTVYNAFRFVDKDGDDMIDRWEVRNFFRNHGSKTKLADLFFDTMDTEREGKISFHAFQKRFTPFIQPGYHPPRPDECQREYYKGETSWGTSQYDPQSLSKGIGCMHGGSRNALTAQSAPSSPSNRSRRKSKSSNRSSSISSARSSRCNDELHLNRFGKFEGMTTYQASFNQCLFKDHL